MEMAWEVIILGVDSGVWAKIWQTLRVNITSRICSKDLVFNEL
jgi:hypothetical protein